MNNLQTSIHLWEIEINYRSLFNDLYTCCNS